MAFIQSVVIGLCLLLAGIPWAGVLAAIALVLGVAQLPALLVTLPVIAYIWIGGDYSTGSAVVYTVLLFVAGMLDNVLKPLMLGRGVEAPCSFIRIAAASGWPIQIGRNLFPSAVFSNTIGCLPTMSKLTP